jgi:flagellar basal-body rod protein FlgB
MGISIDKAFGIHDDALMVRSKRTELLAENLANANTPAYKARDFDFRDALATVQTPGQTVILEQTDPAHQGGGMDTVMGAEVLYRVPYAASLDGNTVETQREQAEFSENVTRYQASLEFLTSRINGLIFALKGQ